ncbi:hypothetical protein AB0L35_16595 [Streptomyces sp. NPDC052309]|uniref:hypothetical protein n=1 Tax=Streptomyces sp. NPDC052309 TaxID=3155421 RepID=UPI003427BC80
MSITIGDWTATVTGDPLPVTPRFTGNSVDVAGHADRQERERFLAATFGSREGLWDASGVLRFDRDSRQLVGAEFRMPYAWADSETSARVPVMPAVRPGGVRADQVRDFRLEMCTVLCRAPGDEVLVCLRDPGALDGPPEARIGIAPDVTLLARHGTVAGWSLTDPARYLTTGFADPDPAPPSEATRRLLGECLDLVGRPVFDEVADGDPAALARLRAVDEALRAQREDRHRADALLALIGTLVEDCGDW